VLPGVERMPLETMRKLEQFVRGGGIVIATRRLPDIVPGFTATPTEQTELRQSVKGLFGGLSGKAYLIEDEKQLGTKLSSLLPADLSLRPAAPQIGFVHRRTADADIYFVANTSNIRQKVNATFRVAGGQAEWWDPFSGKVSPAQIDASTAGTTLPLDLEPYGSRILLFSKRTLPKAAAAPMLKVPAAIDLRTGWRVSIGANTKPVVMDQLQSWTDNEATRYFSGTATYEKEVTVPADFPPTGMGARLDFGEGKAETEQPLRSGMQAWLDAPVREAAVVYVNGSRVGSVWCPPYSLEVGDFLRRGNNQIRIVVANLAVNYMAGRRPPDYRLLNLRYGERFQAQDMDKVQPVPSGLLGPIRLIFAGR
jgi:hypothetical protein